MLSLDGAVNVSRIHSLQIIQMIRAGKIHSAETADGFLLLCVNSLDGDSNWSNAQIGFPKYEFNVLNRFFRTNSVVSYSLKFRSAVTAMF